MESPPRRPCARSFSCVSRTGITASCANASMMGLPCARLPTSIATVYPNMTPSTAPSTDSPAASASCASTCLLATASMLTIGHSNRSLADLLVMLAAHRVELLVDVRTVPRSRHNPQFNTEALPGALAEAGIEYLHMPALGGLRHPRKDSRNTGWRNLSFRGYADYMQTAEFEANLARLT